MSSKMSAFFPETEANNVHRSFPAPGINPIRQDNVAIGITFRGDPGYLRVKTEQGRDRFMVKPYATKSTLRKEAVDLKFEFDQTVEEFFLNGPDTNKVHVENELEGDSLNKAVHLLRCFARWTNSSGSYYGRSSILT